jgi:hypothetical protein
MLPHVLTRTGGKPKREEPVPPGRPFVAERISAIEFHDTRAMIF